MNSCKLCPIKTKRPEGWNVPLFESKNFIVLPSLGSLVEGWLLLVPKRHFICIGALPNAAVAEMEEMKLKAISVLQDLYGEVCAFEHGPSQANVRLGCGVDHAHLHLVPLTFDLALAVAPFLPTDLNWSNAGLRECQVAFAKKQDYLYLEQPIGNGRIAKHANFGSQLFRRAIAEAVGSPNDFNWRDHPRLSTVAATVNTITSSSQRELPCQTLAKAIA